MQMKNNLMSVTPTLASKIRKKYYDKSCRDESSTKVSLPPKYYQSRGLWVRGKRLGGSNYYQHIT